MTLRVVTVAVRAMPEPGRASTATQRRFAPGRDEQVERSPNSLSGAAGYRAFDGGSSTTSTNDATDIARLSAIVDGFVERSLARVRPAAMADSAPTCRQRDQTAAGRRSSYRRVNLLETSDRSSRTVERCAAAGRDARRRSWSEAGIRAGNADDRTRSRRSLQRPGDCLRLGFARQAGQAEPRRVLPCFCFECSAPLHCCTCR